MASEAVFSRDAVLYGQPGSDFGKGHVYTFASDLNPISVYSPLPSRFSWADYGKKPAVRDQGNLGTCWALTAAEALESALLPDEDIVFSADHISLKNGFDITQDEGGDYSMIMAYLSGMRGPVPESEDPYGDEFSPDGLKPAACVKEMRLLAGMSGNRIRHMIYRFGPIQSSMTMDRERADGGSYYNPDTCGYYDPAKEQLDHDVLILGWDDSWSAENFRIRPRQDGAWICQNTWGSEFGDEGIFYVSYEDAGLLRAGGIAYTDIGQPDEFDEILEQDSLGWQARQGYGDQTAYAAGVFKAEKDQELSAVGFYAVGPGTAYEIFLVPDYRDTVDLNLVGQPDSSTRISAQAPDSEILFLGSGWLENPGYYCISFAEPEKHASGSLDSGWEFWQQAQRPKLSKGQKFAIILRLDVPNETRPVAVETRKDRYTQSVSYAGRETYISRDGTRWERTQTVYRTNVCMKLYLNNR